MTLVFLALITVAGVVLGAEKPAALQVCVQLPEGVALFEPGPFAKTIANDVAMLDFDLTLNGHPPERITRSGPDCLRAWLPAERVKQLTFDFSRLPLNLVHQDVPVDILLKADLWSDGGKVVIARVPFSSAVSTLPGRLVMLRQSLSGTHEETDWNQLPIGRYRFVHTPPPPPMSTCGITLKVVGTGTVTPQRHGELFAELVESYRKDLLPGVIARHKLQCDPAELAQVVVRLHDGAFLSPLDPAIVRVRVPEREPRYEVRVDGKAMPFESGLQLDVGTGQRLEFSMVGPGG